MTYRIVHKTTYKYKYPVTFGHHVAYLTPRPRTHQVCTSHELLVTPVPIARSEWCDYFGNMAAFFAVQEPHSELKIEARSRVVIDGDPVAWPKRSPAWDDVARILPADQSPAGLDAYQFVFESPRVKPSASFAAYASQSFPPARELTAAVLDLTERIYKNFRFDTDATS